MSHLVSRPRAPDLSVLCDLRRGLSILLSNCFDLCALASSSFNHGASRLAPWIIALHITVLRGLRPALSLLFSHCFAPRVPASRSQSLTHSHCFAPHLLASRSQPPPASCLRTATLSYTITLLSRLVPRLRAPPSMCFAPRPRAPCHAARRSLNHIVSQILSIGNTTSDPLIFLSSPLFYKHCLSTPTSNRTVIIPHGLHR